MIKNINKANELIKQTEKEALEIIKKREFIKSKIVDNSIAIDFIIDMKEIKEIFLTSPYSDDKIFLEILKEYKCK